MRKRPSEKDNGPAKHSCGHGGLLVLEGPDGVGKTTFAKALVESFAGGGVKAKLLSFPGHEAATIGAVVYGLHHDPKSWGLNPLDPAVLQVLHIAAHLDMIRNRSYRPWQKVNA